MKRLSIVVPVMNEQDAIPLFYHTTLQAVEQLEGVEIEFMFVDDGSTDATLSVIKSLAQTDERVRYVSLSRNFGKESSMLAGLQYASGDYIAIMDVDLQDPPALLPQMLKEIQENGYDCVGTCRVTRKGEPFLRSLGARWFYALINKMSKTEIRSGARDYQMMTRQVAQAILSIGEYNRFSKGISGWVGFRRKWIEYENVERAAGKSKWSMWKLFVYALDGITAYSTVPLVVAFFLGVLLCLGSFLFIVLLIIRTLIFGDPTQGWPSLVCIIVLLAGIQLLFFGVIGQYLAKTYLETKRRPIFIIREASADIS